jgi:hypothetical protein
VCYGFITDGILKYGGYADFVRNVSGRKDVLMDHDIRREGDSGLGGIKPTDLIGDGGLVELVTAEPRSKPVSRQKIGPAHYYASGPFTFLSFSSVCSQVADMTEHYLALKQTCRPWTFRRQSYVPQNIAIDCRSHTRSSIGLIH